MATHAFSCTPVLLLALALSGCANNGLHPVTPMLGSSRSLGGIAVKPPRRWEFHAPSSQMRRAEWTIGQGDETATLIVYYFGKPGAGSPQANLERWYSQFQQPDGRPTRDVARVSETTAAGMSITQVDVGGRYVAAIRPGSDERYDKPGWHLLAAIVAAPDGPYYFKLVGPRPTVLRARLEFAAVLDSVSATGAPQEATAPGHPDGQAEPQTGTVPGQPAQR